MKFDSEVSKVKTIIFLLKNQTRILLNNLSLIELVNHLNSIIWFMFSYSNNANFTTPNKFIYENY